MRALLLAVLLLPTAGAWGVEVRAPAEASALLPFPVEVCAEGGARGQVRLEVENGSLAGAREDRYAPAMALPGCARFVVEPDVGVARLHARVRPENGSAKAEARVDVALRDDVDVRIVELRHERVLLRNDGISVPVGLLELEAQRVAFPLEAGEARWADVPPRGEVRLSLRGHALDAFPATRLTPFVAATRDGLVPLGRTDVRAEPARSEGRLIAYATPDAGVAPLVALVDGAREEVLVEGYAFTSPELAAALGRALERGAAVRVLLDAAPVGGVPEAERGILAALALRGADVRMLAPGRYATLHAKVVVVDRAAVSVATENWHASSYPALGDAHGTRGYGLVLHDAALARRLADVWDADAARAWPDVVDAPRFPPAPLAGAPALAAGPTFETEGARNVTLVLSPDAPDALLRALEDAARTVDVAMLSAEPGSPFVDALVAAQARGVRVRFLLDGRFDERNVLAAARVEGAKLDRPDRTLHAKLVLVDGRVAYVGSMNWVEAAVEKNREAGLLVEDEALAAWLGGWFERDWRGPPQETPAGAAVALAALALSLRLRRGRA